MFFARRGLHLGGRRVERKPSVVKLNWNFPKHRNLNMDVETLYFETIKVLDGMVVKVNHALTVAYFRLEVSCLPWLRRSPGPKKPKTCTNCIGGKGGKN